jgi:hypothetical protein
MFENTRAFVEYMQALPPEAQSSATTWLVVELIGRVTMYIVTGVVVWALGRRLIQAATYAYKESQRERA